jgi:hypothetical protein
MNNQQSTTFLETLLKIIYWGSMAVINYMGMTMPIRTRANKLLFKMVR